MYQSSKLFSSLLHYKTSSINAPNKMSPLYYKHMEFSSTNKPIKIPNDHNPIFFIQRTLFHQKLVLFFCPEPSNIPFVRTLTRHSFTAKPTSEDYNKPRQLHDFHEFSDFLVGSRNIVSREDTLIKPVCHYPSRGTSESYVPSLTKFKSLGWWGYHKSFVHYID